MLYIHNFSVIDIVLKERKKIYCCGINKAFSALDWMLVMRGTGVGKLLWNDLVYDRLQEKVSGNDRCVSDWILQINCCKEWMPNEGTMWISPSKQT